MARQAFWDFILNLLCDRMPGYLITWYFCDTFISRFWGGHISWHLNSAILLKFCILNHFNFTFNSNTQFISLAMLHINMSLNSVNWLYQRYNNVKSNKNAMVGLYVNSNIMFCSRHLLICVTLISRLFFKSQNLQNWHVAKISGRSNNSRITSKTSKHNTSDSL